MLIIIWVVATNAITLWVCYEIFKRALTNALIKQARRLHDHYKKRIDQLKWDFNHEGPIPPATSIIGMTGIISWGLLRCLEQFEALLKAKDWNTKEPTTELREIVLNELALLRSTIKKYLDTRRTILKDDDNTITE